MDKKLINKLSKRKGEGTLRSLSCFDGFIDFYSNDYLGLSKIDLEQKATVFGSGGSRLISGNSHEAEECEAFLASFFQSESALVFNSGYDANLGFFSSVPQRGDTVLFDEAIHASIRDGIRLSNAESFSFRHNDLADLIKKLEKAKGTIYVAVEGLYSMDGDLGKLKEIQMVSERFGAYLIVDEAHSAGVFGESGRGLVVENGLQGKIFARIVTFGKAYGSHGACILGSKELKDYLINFARSFIYTTALPPEQYVRIQRSVNYPGISQCQKELNEKIQLFKKNIDKYELISDDHSPIQMLRIGEIVRTKKISEVLQEFHFAVKPVFSPTVKVGNEGIRICLHSFNEDESIIELCNCINEIKI